MLMLRLLYPRMLLPVVWISVTPQFPARSSTLVWLRRPKGLARVSQYKGTIRPGLFGGRVTLHEYTCASLAYILIAVCSYLSPVVSTVAIAVLAEAYLANKNTGHNERSISNGREQRQRRGAPPYLLLTSLPRSS